MSPMQNAVQMIMQNVMHKFVQKHFADVGAELDAVCCADAIAEKWRYAATLAAGVRVQTLVW